MGGANQSGWNLGEPVQQLLRTAGAVLLQREIPEEINLQVAQVGQNMICVDRWSLLVGRGETYGDRELGCNACGAEGVRD